MPNNPDPYLLIKASHFLFQKSPDSLDAEQRQQAEKQAVHELMLQQKIMASSEAQGIEVTEDELTDAKKSIEQNYPDTKSFSEEMQHYQLDDAQLRHGLSCQIKVDKVMQLVAATAEPVTDAEVAEFYHANTSKFNQPELRQAAHILITINDQFPENEEAVARSRLQAIEQQLQDDLTQFDALARRHSECTTALEGGKLGKVPQGKLYPELDAVLFEMAEQSLSGIVHSPVGMHLLHCIRIHPAGIAPLDEAEAAVRNHLQTRREQVFQRQWMKQLLAD